MMTVKEISYSVYGRCVCATYEDIELIATLEVGPRIVSLKNRSSVNPFYNDVTGMHLGRAFADKTKKQYGEESGVWHNYGGHRLWTSPESAPRTPYPDNAPIEYVVGDDSIKFIQPIQKWTNIGLEIEIRFEGKNTLNVYHRLTNHGAWDAEFAPWALSVLDAGGVEIIPLPDNDTGFLANTWVSLWSYCKMNDKRIYWGDKYITITQDKECTNPLKIGLRSLQGWSAYHLNDTLFVKYFTPYYEDGVFPDGGMNFETYTEATFIEMETLGQLKKVKPGETVEHKETWEIFDNVSVDDFSETSIDKLVEKYIIQ